MIFVSIKAELRTHALSIRGAAIGNNTVTVTVSAVN